MTIFNTLDLATAINKFDVQINRECNKYLGDIVPPLESREAVSIHNLRGLWGAIASYFFCPQTSHEYPFLQHYLGHAIDSSATGHYFRYRLIDEHGNYLENRGILITQFGELPINNSQQQQTITTDEVGTASIDETTETELQVTKAMPSLTATEITDEQPTETILNITHPSLSLKPSVASHFLASSLQNSLTELLNSDPAGISAKGGVRYPELLTGLMAVTGRTAGELLKSKKFFPHPTQKQALLFSSTVDTAKTELPTLVDGATVIEAISRLKSHPDVQPLLYLSPSEIDSRCLPHITKTLLSRMLFKNIDEMITTYQTLIDTSDQLPQPEKQKRPSTTIYNLYSDDRHRLDAIADSLGIEGTQAAVFHSLIDWVEEQLEQNATSVEPLKLENANTVEQATHQAISDLAKTLAWLTDEITSFRQRVQQLEIERDDLQSQLEQSLLPHPQVDQLQSENDRLKSELEKANATLSVFRQLLNGNDDPPNEPLGAKSEPKSSFGKENPKAAAVPDPVQSSKVAVSLGKKLDKEGQSSKKMINYDTHELNKQDCPSLSMFNDSQLTRTSETTPKNRRKPRADGGARQRAIAIFNALQQWNQLHPDYTFAMTPALLEVTFHIHRAAAHQFIEEFKEQIAQHHQTIGVTTLRTHNRGKDVEPFKAFVEQGG
ncbi:protelomerase family protein [Chroococcus sp. FPU101]|uniref:protelomerase family protein n=1 Tax=Chroococcus sp. FPU101 TaxID=1974212 RepID=UPI001F5CF6FE|nr:protelomerase family protein [Chroococcus sp. FPU101]